MAAPNTRGALTETIACPTEVATIRIRRLPAVAKSESIRRVIQTRTASIRAQVERGADRRPRTDTAIVPRGERAAAETTLTRIIREIGVDQGYVLGLDTGEIFCVIFSGKIGARYGSKKKRNVTTLNFIGWIIH